LKQLVLNRLDHLKRLVSSLLDHSQGAYRLHIESCSIACEDASSIFLQMQNNLQGKERRRIIDRGGMMKEQ
jgi:hypothetical protein